MQQLGKVCGDYLTIKAKKNQDIWVLDGDLADSDGAEIFSTTFPKKFLACGIAEQNMISVAAGLASIGAHPWVFSFSAFLCYRAYDQIRTCVSQTNLPVTIIGSHAGGCGGRNGKTHLSLNDIALMASLPNIQIWAPADANDTKFVIDCILQNKTPTYIRLPREHVTIIPGNPQTVKWIGIPSSIALISYGLSTHWALQTQQLLKKQDINIGILHFCKIWPIDINTINDLLKNVEVAFVLEDHYAFGGLATALHIQGFKGQILNWAWPSNWTGQSGKINELLDYCSLSPNILCNEINNIIKKHKNNYLLEN